MNYICNNLSRSLACITVLLTVLLFFSFSTTVLAAGAVNGEISIGGGMSNDRDNHAEEYTSNSDDGGIAGINGKINYQNSVIDLHLNGDFSDNDDQTYGGGIDIGRIIGIEMNYQKFGHYLDQDNLLHMQATSAGPGFGAQLLHSYEYAPELTGDDGQVPKNMFGIDNEDTNARIVLRVPNVTGLKVGMDFRYNQRQGCQQTMGISKCGSCHIVAHAKKIDETTTDFKPFVEATIGNLSLKYTFLYREFDVGGGLDHSYEVARHPFKGYSGKTDMYGGVNYDYRDGNLALSATPESTKLSHSIKGMYRFNQNHSTSFNYVHSSITNTSSDDFGYATDELEMKYDAGMFSYAGKFSKDLLVTARARYQTIDNDDAKVVTAGGSYERESAYNRDTVSGKIDVRYRLFKNLTLRSSYTFESEDRDNGEFLVEEKIDTHTVKASAKWRARRNLTVSTAYKFAYVNNPYTYENAAYPEHCDLGVDDSGNWDGTLGTYEPAAYMYSKYVYGARTHNMSASPETEHEARIKVNWSPWSNVFVSAYSKYVRADNDQDMHYDYTSDTIDSGIDVTLTPCNKMAMTIGYNNFYRSTDSTFYIPYYHG